MTLELGLDTGLDLPSIFQLIDNLEKFFESKSYGDGIYDIFIVAVCRPEYLNLKQRKNFDASTNTLYFDAMVNFESVKSIQNVVKKKQFFHESIRDSIVAIKSFKEGFPEFNFEKFELDWRNFFWEFSWW